MTEEEFWVHLEMRLCQEFAGLAERRYRYFWCDGLTPDRYELEAPAPRIKGRAWIVNGHDYMQWTFTLRLPKPVLTPRDIDWPALLPDEHVTCWMSFDESTRSLDIDPSAARPDLK